MFQVSDLKRKPNISVQPITGQGTAPLRQDKQSSYKKQTPSANNVTNIVYGTIISQQPLISTETLQNVKFTTDQRYQSIEASTGAVNKYLNSNPWIVRLSQSGK